MSTCAYFSPITDPNDEFSYLDCEGVADKIYNSDPLRYELLSMRQNGESKYYWISTEFIVDKVTPAQENKDITLYYIRRRYQRKSKTAILQSNWAGMEYLKLIERK